MITLPVPIAAYVKAANANTPEELAACFAPDATVHDEGHSLRGRAQIAQWAADTGNRYRATIEPSAIVEQGGRHLMRASVRGDFPGSPITLAFLFALGADGIRALEVKA